MISRSASPNAFSLLIAAGLIACGAGSSLDDYSDGVPRVVPNPLPSDPDAGDDAGGGDAGGGDAGGGSAGGGSAGGGSAGGGSAGGGSAGGGSADIGQSCTKNEECSGDAAECLTSVNVVILTLDFPGGYCSQLGCQTDDDCPDGSGCLALTTSCLQTCTRNSDCRTDEDYECAAAPLGGGTAQYCLPSSVASLGGGSAGALGGLFGGAGTGALGGLFGGGGN